MGSKPSHLLPRIVGRGQFKPVDHRHRDRFRVSAVETRNAADISYRLLALTWFSTVALAGWQATKDAAAGSVQHSRTDEMTARRGEKSFSDQLRGAAISFSA